MYLDERLLLKTTAIPFIIRFLLINELSSGENLYRKNRGITMIWVGDVSLSKGAL